MNNDISMLKQLVGTGVCPKVRFTKTAEDIDWRWEEGMIGYVVSVTQTLNDVKIVVEEREFAEYNKTLEKPVWFGENDELIPYSQTRSYEKWTGAGTIIESEDRYYNFELLEDGGNPLFAEYFALNLEDTPYVRWLEAELLKARAATK